MIFKTKGHLIWAFTMLVLFIIVFFINPLPNGLKTSVNTAWLHFSFPDSNWRSYGASLVLLPFGTTTVGLNIALFVFFIGGLLFYYLICAELLKAKFLAIGLWTLPFNTYLFWSYKSQQELVLEWFFLLGAIYFLLEKSFIISSFFCFLASFVRPANIVLSLFIVFIIVISIKAKVIFTSLLIIWLTVNSIVYGTFSPALQASYTMNYGWNRAYSITLPLADIDASYTKFDPLNSKVIDSTSDEKLRAQKYYDQALGFIRENPAQSVAILTSKIDSWFFTIQRVPNLKNSFSTSADGLSLKLNEPHYSFLNTCASLVFAVWRVFYLFVWIPSIFF